MEVIATPISGVFEIVPLRHGDQRGWLAEVWNRQTFAEHSIDVEFVQQNQSRSAYQGTVRGLHYQDPPFVAAKLVRVDSGSILDIAVDLRVGSPTYGQHHAAELDAAEGRQLFLPEGTAHGFCTTSPDTVVTYFSSARWTAESDRGIYWADPELGIRWPVGEDEAIVSEKDAGQPRFSDIESPFSYSA